MAPAVQRKPPGLVVRTIGRLITKAAVHAPWSWRFLSGAVERFVDRLAPGWDARVGSETEARLAPLEAALAYVERTPRRALDIGTGTGAGALFIAKRYPEADVLGIDLSGAMIAVANEKAATRERPVTFAVADIAGFEPSDPYDLVLMLNMPPFFEHVSALLAPGGYVVSIASRGPTTPFYSSATTLERGFARYGLRTVAAGSHEAATYHVAERPPA